MSTAPNVVHLPPVPLHRRAAPLLALLGRIVRRVRLGAELLGWFTLIALVLAP